MWIFFYTFYHFYLHNHCLQRMNSVVAVYLAPNIFFFHCKCCTYILLACDLAIHPQTVCLYFFVFLTVSTIPTQLLPMNFLVLQNLCVKVFVLLSKTIQLNATNVIQSLFVNVYGVIIICLTYNAHFHQH